MIAITTIALIAHDIGRDPAGHALQVSVGNALMLQLPLYLSTLALLMAVWSAMAKGWPRRRPLVDALAVFLCVALVWLTQLDLGMQRFRGERIALAHLRLYGSGQVINSDWILPLLEMPVTLALLLGLAVGTSVWLLWPWRPRAILARTAISGRVPLFWLGVAILGQLPGRMAYDHQRVMALSPVESLLREAMTAPRVYSAAEERSARDAMRQWLDPLGRRPWPSETAPLWHSPDWSTVPQAGAAAQAPPDILLFTVESLRGHDVGWGFAPRPAGQSVTPQLDALAREAVTFPHWIASGEPSPRGFITLHTGMWEHGSGFIIANYPELCVDALPQRLRSAGYHTMAIWGGNPSFDNQLTWARRWYDDLDFERPGNELFYFRTRSDREVMDHLLQRVAAHDATRPGQPFFAYVASNGTHTPYTLEDPAPEIEATTATTLTRQARYDRVLRNVDAQIGRVITALRQRSRWRNTVVIVVGDHADRTDEPDDRQWTGTPTDALVGTAALIYGPSALVGPPRVNPMTASHVDLLPTVLSWLGDTAAFTTMGRSVFDTARVSAREAVSINSRGVRLDRGGYSLLVAREDPSRFRAWRAFTGEQPVPLPLSATPFAPDTPHQLLERVRYWSHLVEHDRVRP
ncbi:MAG: sulfatase-like hydrolase/transferase [Gemmatimonadaceae bacterium]